ncbi:MAG: cyclic nucleotide-binding domain-containing protein, partial [Sphingomonas sp.]
MSRFTAFATLTLDDFTALAKLANGRRHFARGEFVCHEGDRPTGLFLLLKGWTASSMTFANGARILLKVHLPGDMLGMPSLALRESADTIVALTDVHIGVVSRDELGRLFEENARLAALLFLCSHETRLYRRARPGLGGRHVSFGPGCTPAARRCAHGA